MSYLYAYFLAEANNVVVVRAAAARDHRHDAAFVTVQDAGGGVQRGAGLAPNHPAGAGLVRNLDRSVRRLEDLYAAWEGRGGERQAS